MGILHSIAYGYYDGLTEFPDNITILFRDIDSITLKAVEELNNSVDWSSKQLGVKPESLIDEFIDYAMKKDLYEKYGDDFNLNSFLKYLVKQDYLQKHYASLRTVSIDDTLEFEEAQIMASNGVFNTEMLYKELNNNAVGDKTVARLLKSAYEEYEDNDELQYAIQSIKESKDDLLKVEQVDIIVAIKRAVKGVPESIDIIKKICEKYTVLAEMIQIVLSSNQPVEELFA